MNATLFLVWRHDVEVLAQDLYSEGLTGYDLELEAMYEDKWIPAEAVDALANFYLWETNDAA